MSNLADIMRGRSLFELSKAEMKGMDLARLKRYDPAMVSFILHLNSPTENPTSLDLKNTEDLLQGYFTTIVDGLHTDIASLKRDYDDLNKLYTELMDEYTNSKSGSGRNKRAATKNRRSTRNAGGRNKSNRASAKRITRK